MALTLWPPVDPEPWPTLGHGVIDLIQEKCVHGPGALAGKPVRLSDEGKYRVLRHYEIYPRGHARAGRRRFAYCVDSLTKGSAKTEDAVFEVFAELHPEAEVRFDGWKRIGSAWVPAGRPVSHPFIPMVANTEEQTEDLGYGVLKFVVENSPDSHLFDSSLERIIRLDPWGRDGGTAKPFAAAPDSRDGALPTHIHYDELHRWISERLKAAHTTMQENLTKRTADEPWAHATSTTYTPGEGSVLEADHEAVDEMVKDPGSGDRSWFFMHRWAPVREGEDLDDPDQLRAAIREAKGPLLARSWDHFDDLVEDLVASRSRAKRQGKLTYWERVQLNRRESEARKPFPKARWTNLGRERDLPKRGTAITLGLDGSRYRDTTALIATELATGWQWVAGIWVPAEQENGEVPIAEVEATGDDLAAKYFIVRAYVDPAAGYRELASSWSGKWGARRVAEFWTDSRGLRRTAEMLQAYEEAQRNGDLTHSVGRPNDDTYAEHVGNAVRRYIKLTDEDGQPLWLISKERDDSPKKIDAAMGGGMSWQARLDAIAAGDVTAAADPKPSKASNRIYTLTP